MVAKLRAKPGGDQIAVTMGNFADVAVQGSYRLIYVVFNTLFNLLTQEEQVRCFENVAAHLTEDGSFVPTYLTLCWLLSISVLKRALILALPVLFLCYLPIR
jgi:hypothetical protein